MKLYLDSMLKSPFDLNSTFFPQVSEFRVVMERTDWPPMDEKTLLEILNKFDKNKNGFIDYNSFLTGKSSFVYLFVSSFVCSFSYLAGIDC